MRSALSHKPGLTELLENLAVVFRLTEVVEYSPSSFFRCSWFSCLVHYGRLNSSLDILNGTAVMKDDCLVDLGDVHIVWDCANYVEIRIPNSK